jgi:hypothetical protein
MDVSRSLEECNEEADYAMLRAELNELGEAGVRARLVGLTLSEIRNEPGTENRPEWDFGHQPTPEQITLIGQLVAQDGSVRAGLSPAPVEESGSGVPASGSEVAGGESGDGDVEMGPSVEESGDQERDPEPEPVVPEAIPPSEGSQRSKGKGRARESDIESTVSRQPRAKGKDWAPAVDEDSEVLEDEMSETPVGAPPVSLGRSKKVEARQKAAGKRKGCAATIHPEDLVEAPDDFVLLGDDRVRCLHLFCRVA